MFPFFIHTIVLMSVATNRIHQNIWSIIQTYSIEKKFFVIFEFQMIYDSIVIKLFGQHRDVQKLKTSKQKTEFKS